MPRIFIILLASLLLCLAGCDETSVHVVMHAKLKIPAELDALCLQIVADRELEFARRYSLSESHAGKPMTATVLPGERHGADFEVLLRGERRGMPVSWLRTRMTFDDNTIKEEHLDIDRCSHGSGKGTFAFGGLLTNNLSSAAGAATPVAQAPGMAVVGWSSKASRFAYIDGGVKQFGGGVPAVPGGAVNSMLAVDVDGDCDQDLVLLHKSGPLVWLQDKTGAFSEKTNAIQGKGAYDEVVSADLDLDGFNDLVLISSTRVEVLRNNGKQTATFSAVAGAHTGLTAVTDVAVGFINRDSYPDIVLARSKVAASANVVLLNDYAGASGSLTFSKIDVKSNNKKTTSVAVAYLVQRSVHDVVFVAAGEAPRLLRNDSTKSAVVLKELSAAIPSTDTGAVNQILVADLDDDCDNDLIIARSDVVSILLNDGSGRFAGAGGKALPGSGRVAVIDLNGDGALDLILGGTGSGATWHKQDR